MIYRDNTAVRPRNGEQRHMGGACPLQNLRTSAGGRARRQHVVNEKNALACQTMPPFDAKCARDIFTTLRVGQSSLRGFLMYPDCRVANGYSNASANLGCQKFCLIEAPLPALAPVNGKWNNHLKTLIARKRY